MAMTVVCGVDVGSLTSLSYVAWLEGKHFVLDLYVPSVEQPLPQPPDGMAAPVFIGFDVPQGFPAFGKTRRLADEKANTPTRILPTSREQLNTWTLYKGLVTAGVEIFWTMYKSEQVSILGLPAISGVQTTAFETYPRFVIKTRWPEIHIPSKRKAPLAYVDAIWRQIQADGYSCPGVARPTVDQVDAMLCALAAEALLNDHQVPARKVGALPEVDNDGRVIREGYIVAG